MYMCLSPLGASVEVYSDEVKNLKGLFFQDQQMKDAFKAFPELLCTDATYKLLQVGFHSTSCSAKILMVRVKLLLHAF